jgi:hypothetical protein
METPTPKNNGLASNQNQEDAVRAVPDAIAADLDDLRDATLEEYGEDCLGWTTFDAPGSKDGNVTVLIPRDRIEKLPIQSLVTVQSGDKRAYLASCVQGPFAEPDGLRADSPIVVTATVRGKGMALFPRFHGRGVLEILGEFHGKSVQSAALRPLPNSKVYPLPKADAIALLRTDGNLPIGDAPVGQYEVRVHARTTEKIGFPRHTAVLGTTGGGKSTTVSGMVTRAQEVGVPTILLDVEGEYVAMYEPTQDETMRAALDGNGLKPEGAKNVSIYALAGRESKCPDSKRVKPFTLTFSELSAYAVCEILEFNDAQQQRYWTAYDLTKKALAAAKIFGSAPTEKAEALLIDEIEIGWPKMKLGHVYDIVRMIVAKLDKSEMPSLGTFPNAAADDIKKLVDAAQLESNKYSWMAVLGRLGTLHRLRIFDDASAKPLDLDAMIAGDAISIIDLSDTDSPMMRNLAIAQILRRVQLAQDRRYDAEQARGDEHHPTLVVIEEAHEFLSAERIRDMPNLFGQLSRIAKRGRKRWLSLVFVTQSPSHVPDEVLGLVNNWILHRISDSAVVTRLRKSIGSIDASLWDRVSSLSPGQGIVSLTTIRRAVVTRILPTPCRLLMAD